MWGEFLNNLLEILDFYENADIQAFTEFAILRIENAMEVFSKILPIILREDRVVT